MNRFLLPVFIAALTAGFWFSPDFQTIAAGVAVFLFGMSMLENGFRLFSGGLLERALEQATASTPRAILFGIVSTSLLQSSSLVSVVTISFLSAGLITLIGGVGIIFGANLGTTTGAWLIAGLGLKVDIGAYAMPLLALSIVLVFQKSKYWRGFGYALAGLGFLFLGIHFMKEGFDAFKVDFDLTRLAMQGPAGLAVYTVAGVFATVLMQSSHATMVLIITALASGQISYDNAIALAIGSNVGSTITAILGAINANHQGKRLALAHLIFNSTTALVTLILITPIREVVDLTSSALGIAPADYAMKLAVFHSIFNVLGVLMMAPMINGLISFLERAIVEPPTDRSQPKYISAVVGEFPQTIEVALRNEVRHLYENAVELIAHGLNLNRRDLFASAHADVIDTIDASRAPIEFDFDELYDQRVKSLYGAIVEFATRTGARDLPPDVMARIYSLRETAGQIVRAVKAIKHLRRNMLIYTVTRQGAVTAIYDGLRAEIARILVEIENLERTPRPERRFMWLDEESARVEDDARSSTQLIDSLIRKGQINAQAATSFLNDSSYGYSAMRNLLSAARTYYIETDGALAQVERAETSVDEDRSAVVASADESSLPPQLPDST